MRFSGRNEAKPSWGTVVRWPVFLLANIALLFIVGVSTVREAYRGWTVDREIRALEAQAASLEGRKMQLQTLTHTLVSPEHVEYEARARLGKKKVGERVIVLEGLGVSSTWSVDSETEDMPESGVIGIVVKPPRSNPERWWDYFFSVQ